MPAGSSSAAPARSRAPTRSIPRPPPGSGTTTVRVAKRATMTSVDCVPPRVPVNSATTCTATVTDTSPGTMSVPSGTVTFTSTGTGTFSSTSCTLGATGTCSVTYTPTAVGTGLHTITATYGGDAKHLTSSGTTTVLVTKRATRTSVSCTPVSVPVNSPTTCTATVTDTATGSTSTPTGMVLFASSGAGTFSGNPCTLSGSGASSSCSVTYTPTLVGTGAHLISADYSGDLKHAPSSGSTTVSVTKRATSTTLGCVPSSFAAGGSTTCTATVRDTDIGTKITPTGTVTFGTSDTGTFVPPACDLIPTTTLGVASCFAEYGSTHAATQTITATYGGDISHFGSSGATTVTVTSGSPFLLTLMPPTETRTVNR